MRVPISIAILVVGISLAEGGERKYDGKTVAEWAALLKDPNPERRAEGIRALEKIGEEAAPAAPTVIAAMSDSDSFVRKAATGLVWRFGPAASAAVPVLVEILKHPEDDRLSDALLAATLLKVSPEPLVPPVIALLDDKNSRTVGSAIGALLEFGAVAKAAVPALIKIVSDEGSHHRNLAILALGRMGPAAKSAIPSLRVPLLVGEPFTLRLTAAQALCRIGFPAEDVLPTYERALRSRDPEIRSNGLLIPQPAPDVGVFVPGLLAGLSDESPAVRTVAAQAVERVGDAAVEAVPLLTEALDSQDRGFAWQAAQSLAKIGSAAAAAVPALEKYSKSAAAPTDRILGIHGLIGILGKQAAYVPPLVMLLSDPSWIVRGHAAEELGTLGSAAKTAVPALQGLAEGDEDPVVRREARRALAAIGGG